MNLITIILTIYTWLVIGGLLFFLFAIARFYEKKSGQRSFYPVFGGAIVLFMAAMIRYLFVTPLIIGDVWGDLLRFIGSLLVGGFGLLLLKRMTGGSPRSRQPKE